MNSATVTPAKSDNSNVTIPSDILDDLCSRFIVNIPEKHRRDPIRLCFQIEQAHWFYLDFYCSGENSAAAKNCGFKDFAYNVFKHLSSLRPYLPELDSILEKWREYKMAVPTFGAILLNQDLTKVLLVQGFWAKSSWGFPKGKVNEGEDPAHCAIREVLEETGFDASSILDPAVFLECTVNDQLTRLYVVPGISEDTKFIPRTRCEIRAVQWFLLADLPISRKDTQTKSRVGFSSSSFFMVVPFVKLIRNWVASHQQRKQSLLNRRQRCKSTEDSGRSVNISPQPTSKLQNTRRQLFPSMSLDTSSSKTSSGTPSLKNKPPVRVCAPSWQNFKLDMKPILACFDDL